MPTNAPPAPGAIDGCVCATCTAQRLNYSLLSSYEPDSEVPPQDSEPFYSCAECGTEWPYLSDADECCASRYWCDNCEAEFSDPDEARACCRSEYDNDVPTLPPLEPYMLTVPALPQRPARVCSIEQEVTAGGYRAARLMYEQGLAESDELRGYSQDCRPGGVIVKEDGSLPEDGGEIVYSRFRLSDESAARTLSLGIGRVRQLRDMGLVSSGEDAGTHIHIAAVADNGDTFEPQHLAALHELFCGLEDMLYALAACGWNEHRLDDYNDGYCKTLPKIHDATPAKVIQSCRGDRYLGLNFGRLFQQVSRCTCGACLVGAWRECDCGVLSSATVEWRLFNSTTRPETMHAWLLIAHGLTAYAAHHPLGTLGPRELRSGTPATRWRDLEWMLRMCPFTDDERDVIRDAARRSPGFGERSDTY